MKKLFVLSLLGLGVMGTTLSIAQDKKADKKEGKAIKKEDKSKMTKSSKKAEKMEKKETKAK